ncbi:MAG: LuxR C-terminal-related transcriptional regulator [Clostridiales Family XIII bacterium]|jgi:ATP/maltotriose-dependent transcriptional regulator MalT|nr:LuxR C-terminal-related transcriptional regulator [Clostridiales Family XIII bacterium]
MGIGENAAGFPTQWGLLERPRVTALFECAVQGSLVTVVAGPGYGKTRAAADFVMGAKARAVWTRIGRIEGSPPLFWKSFARAAGEAFPARSAWLDALGFPELPSKMASFLQMLEDEASDGPPIFLVFDDCSYIADAVGSLFEAIAEARIRNLCLMLVGCGRISAETAGLRSGGLRRIGGDGLRFDGDEAGRLFALRGHSPSDSSLRKIMRHTEGWALALHVLSLEGAGDAERVFAAPESCEGFAAIDDMFSRDFFSAYGTDIRRLLVKLSLISDFPLKILHEALDDRSPAEARGAYAEAAATAIMSNPFISYSQASGLCSIQGMYRRFLSGRQFLLGEGEKARFLLAAGAAPRDGGPRASAGLTLSRREIEVLCELSQGLTREEIANKKYISVNTVKSEIKSIYNKLGAVNRADAVRISTGLGILK